MGDEHKTAESSVKNVTVGSVFGWIFGIIFIIAGISTVWSSPVTGVIEFFLGIFLLPAFDDALKKQHGTHISGGVKVLIVLLFVIISSIVSASDKAEKAAANATSGNANTTPIHPSQEAAQLELLSYSCTTEYDYFIISGQVKNISFDSLKNIEAVGTMYTAKDDFINSSSALLEYNPILPGQTSPFKVMMTNNPESGKCSVDFKSLFGGTISTKRDKK